MTATTEGLGTTRCGVTTFEWGSRTYVMGIINLTPDSFSGDGLGADVGAAVAQAQQMVADGADLLDIGGVSTRPGSAPVGPAEEAARVLPALRAIRSVVSVPLSVDSFTFEVVQAALDAGADLINDQWGLMTEPRLATLAAERGVPIALMHNLPGGATGRHADLYPEGLLAGIVARLQAGCRVALEAGVPWEQIIVDPGIGFAKGPEQNLETLRHLDDLRAIGRPILLGTSRKGFIGQALGGLPAAERVEGTGATVALGIAKGADLVRVHDVKAMVRVARMADAIVRG